MNSNELCVYVPFWSLEGLAERRGTDVAEVLGWLGGCAVVTAAECQRDVIAGPHTRLVASGEVPDLLAEALEDESSEAVLGRPAKIGVEDGGWGEIGLGAITDIVQQAYGPVAFDVRWWNWRCLQPRGRAARHARGGVSISPLT